MRIAIYARVSTQGQTLAPQLDQLRPYAARLGGEVVEFADIASGKAGADRPQLDQLLKEAKRGKFKVIVVARLDRLARSLGDMVLILDDLSTRGVQLVSLYEAIDTSSATGRLHIHIIAALAEFERNLISDRTKAGLESARLRGSKIGRPKADFDRRLARDLFFEGYSDRQIAAKVGIGLARLKRFTLALKKQGSKRGDDSSRFESLN